MIKIYDNVLEDIDNKRLYQRLISLDFYYGEKDRSDCPCTGVVHDIQDQKILAKFLSLIHFYHSDFLGLKVSRAYVNLFFPNERPYFHTDGDVYTCLFYLNPELDIDEGGETQFLVDNSIHGVLSRPGRLVVFDGNILHRATSFRSYPRLSVAIKFFKESQYLKYV